MAARTRRGHRRPDRRILRLTERACWLLEALGKMRFLTTSQVAGLGFNGSRWAAQKRLRRLFDRGLVRVWVRDLASDNLYSLDRAGATVLDGQSHESGAWSTPRGLNRNLEHLLAINQVRVFLVLGLQELGGEILWWRSDWELRTRFRDKVIPDALFLIEWVGMGKQVFALEVENCSRSPRKFITKILRYRSLVARGGGLYGTADFITLVVGRDDRSLERYRISLGHAQLSSRVWFTALEELEANGAGGAIWRSLGADRCHSLRDLSTLPYGKEGQERKTVGISGR